MILYIEVVANKKGSPTDCFSIEQRRVTELVKNNFIFVGCTYMYIYSDVPVFDTKCEKDRTGLSL